MVFHLVLLKFIKNQIIDGIDIYFIFHVNDWCVSIIKLNGVFSTTSHRIWRGLGNQPQ